MSNDSCRASRRLGCLPLRKDFWGIFQPCGDSSSGLERTWLGNQSRVSSRVCLYFVSGTILPVQGSKCSVGDGFAYCGAQANCAEHHLLWKYSLYSRVDSHRHLQRITCSIPASRGCRCHRRGCHSCSTLASCSGRRKPVWCSWNCFLGVPFCSANGLATCDIAFLASASVSRKNRHTVACLLRGRSMGWPQPAT